MPSWRNLPIRLLSGLGCVLVLSGCAPTSSAPAEPRAGCPWEPAVSIGALDRSVIDEASGLEISSVFPGRLYHVNDSGDRGRFFLTDMNGQNTQTVAVEGFDPVDAEDLTLGPCGTDTATCLFIADFGDNDRVRDAVEIVLVEERDAFPASVAPAHRFRVRYPEGPQDAESLAMHPNGDLFILTKTADYGRFIVQPSNVYRLRREVWAGAAPGTVIEAELAGQIEFTAISSDFFSGSLPTSVDIAPDGGRFLVLTYNNAFEFYMDLASPWKPASEMQPNVDYRELDIEPLEQQEAVAYEPDGRAFIYETEFIATESAAGRARIMRVACGP